MKKQIFSLAVVVLAFALLSVGSVQAAPVGIDFTGLIDNPSANGEVNGTEFHSQGLDLITTTLAFNVGCGGFTCLGADGASVNDFSGTIVGAFNSLGASATVTSLLIDYCCEGNPGDTNTFLFDSGSGLLASFIDTDVNYSGLPVAFFAVTFGEDAMFTLTYDGLASASVPEPSTLLLLGSGLVGLWGRKRFKAVS